LSFIRLPIENGVRFLAKIERFHAILGKPDKAPRAYRLRARTTTPLIVGNIDRIIMGRRIKTEEGQKRSD
jgi:hypothetical protein